MIGGGKADERQKGGKAVKQLGDLTSLAERRKGGVGDHKCITAKFQLILRIQEYPRGKKLSRGVVARIPLEPN